MTEVTGKYIWTWVIGDVDRDINLIINGGFSGVMVKVADGVYSYNKNHFKLPEYVRRLQSAGLQVWGWHWLYLRDPASEAFRAVERVQSLGLNGYIMDAEADTFGRFNMAEKFMEYLRAGLPSGVPVALSSYRYPDYQPALPWKEFLSRADWNFPQVYFEGAHNPGQQIEDSFDRTREMERKKGLDPTPYVPVGPAYSNPPGAPGWAPTAEDLREFANKAEEMGFPAVMFYRLQTAVNLGLYDTIKAIDYNGSGGGGGGGGRFYTDDEIEAIRAESENKGYNRARGEIMRFINGLGPNGRNED